MLSFCLYDREAAAYVQSHRLKGRCAVHWRLVTPGHQGLKPLVISFYKTREHVMQIALIIIILLTSFWVYFDAKSLQKYKGSDRGVGNTSPGMWFVGSLLLWILFYPLYLVQKYRYLKNRMGKKSPKSKKMILCHSCEKQISRNALNCPECGEINLPPKGFGLWYKIPILFVFFFLVGHLAIDIANQRPASEEIAGAKFTLVTESGDNSIYSMDKYINCIKKQSNTDLTISRGLTYDITFYTVNSEGQEATLGFNKKSEKKYALKHIDVPQIEKFLSIFKYHAEFDNPHHRMKTLMIAIAKKGCSFKA